MGRGGITYIDVMKIAEKLRNQGVIPTIDKVREILGTGSKTTLAHHLKQWKESTVEELEYQKLPVELAKSVKNLHEQLQTHAEQKVEAIEARSQKEIEQLLQQLKQERESSGVLKRNILQHETNNNKLMQQVQTLEKALAELKQININSTVEKNELTTKLQEKIEQILILKDQLKSLENNGEHYREMLKQQRDEEKIQFARHLELLQQENNNLKIKLAEANTQENAIKQELFTLRSKAQYLEGMHENKTKECEMLSNKLFLAIKNQEEVIKDLFEKRNNVKKFVLKTKKSAETPT